MNEFPLNITSTQARTHKPAAGSNAATTADGAEFNALLAQQIQDGATLEAATDNKHGNPLHSGHAAAHKSKTGTQTKGQAALEAASDTQPMMLNALLAQPATAELQQVGNETTAKHSQTVASQLHQAGKKTASNHAETNQGKSAKTHDAQRKPAHTAHDPAEQAAIAGLAAAAVQVPGDVAAPAAVPQEGNVAISSARTPIKGKTAIQMAKAAMPGHSGPATGIGPHPGQPAPDLKSATESKAAGTAHMRQDLAVAGEQDLANTDKLPAHLKPAEHVETNGLAFALPRGNETGPLAPQLNTANANAGQPATSHTLHQPVGSSAWSGEFGQQITWIAKQKDHTAELHLNPPQLGPLDVVLKVSGDQATAQFTSPHAAVRDAVEQAIPKLREMLADSGIMLGNATVSDQAPQRNQEQTPRNVQRRSDKVGTVSSTAVSHESAKTQVRRHNGLVDTFV